MPPTRRRLSSPATRALLSSALVLIALVAACAPAGTTGTASGTGSASAPSQSQTTVSVQGSQILVNGTPSTLFGFRVASAAMRDDWTDELIAQLDTWQEHGVNSFIVWLQGSSGGYTPVFTNDGDIDQEESEVTSIVGFGDDHDNTENGSTTGAEVIERTKRIIEAADERGMVAIVGLFYGSASGDFDDDTLTNAARTAAGALKDYSNVIFNVYNEPDLDDSRTSKNDLPEYMDAVKQAAPGRLVGTGTVDSDDNAEIADMDEVDVLMHDAGSNADEAIESFESLKDQTSKPIINIESFGGSGQGFVDDPTKSVAAPEGYYIDFPEFRRVFGALRDEDYDSDNGSVTGRDGYRRLIDHVAQDPDQQLHLMVHLAGWFQGASRVGRDDDLGDPGTPGRWNNDFEVGPGAADGTPENPGIRWILEHIEANAG